MIFSRKIVTKSCFGVAAVASSSTVPRFVRRFIGRRVNIEIHVLKASLPPKSYDNKVLHAITLYIYGQGREDPYLFIVYIYYFL